MRRRPHSPSGGRDPGLNMLHLLTMQDDGSCRHLPEMSFLISLAGGAPPQAALKTQVLKTNWCKYFGQSQPAAIRLYSIIRGSVSALFATTACLGNSAHSHRTLKKQTEKPFKLQRRVNLCSLNRRFCSHTRDDKLTKGRSSDR